MSRDRGFPNRIHVPGLRHGLFWLLCIFTDHWRMQSNCDETRRKCQHGMQHIPEKCVSSEHRHFTHKSDTCCRSTPKLEHTKYSVSNHEQVHPPCVPMYIVVLTLFGRSTGMLEVSKSNNLTTNKSNLLHNYVHSYFRACSMNGFRFSKPPSYAQSICEAATR